MDQDHQKLYFIAIVPPDDICAEVTDLKNFIAEQYQSKHSLKSPPHITLHMPFKRQEKKEKELTGFLKQFSSGRAPFELELKNFSAFPKRVIYIDVMKNEQMEILYRQLTEAIRSKLNIVKDTYKNQGFTPHMTIAHRDLKPVAFDLAWSEFRDRGFGKRFPVDHICLMKHNGKNWDIFERFSFDTGE